jgi:hypothetical protein
MNMETSEAKPAEEVAERMEMQAPQKPTEKSEVVQIDTSTTATPGSSPASSEDSLVRDVDSSTFIPPEQQDIILTDVTSERLHTEIGDTLGVEYLSIAEGAQQRFMTDDAKQSRGMLVPLHDQLGLPPR